MNSLRTRFAIGFSILFTVFLGTALVIIYMSYAHFRKDEFYSRLKDRALTTYKFLVEVEQIDNNILALIDKNTLNSLNDEKVLIFKNKELIYQNLNRRRTIYNDEMFDKAREQSIFTTTQNEFELVAIHQLRNNDTYTVLASAYDMYGRRKLNYLKWLMIIVYGLGLLIGWAATYFFVKQVIRPLETLKDNIENIHSDNLDTRLKSSGQGREVDSLAWNFNEMLKRLQHSFGFQKDFVHYASHELRTPLTAMVGVTENALSKSLNADQHREVLGQLFRQQQDLTAITNSLLLLSDKKNNHNNYPLARLDELVFRSVDFIRNLYPETLILVNLEGDASNEELMLVRVNEPLIMMAFNNLLKNAIQYSHDQSVIVTIRFLEKEKEIEFKNVGAFFADEEKERLFTPFYRGSNSVLTRGHGLGLPLVKQIAELNKATIKYYRDGDYNIFSFSFKT